ncbi:hypothetical protein FNF28_03650 [Cafeteria roenbergensis]|uniref:HECT domain-containing protein n=1 Tax=Cafeteria roenbergensis TaxID=33653 RepID=A0A5A8DHR2_CAFRO|nr:hypothetical protein FNF28_03650 [Cafeteria roenbergensis]
MASEMLEAYVGMLESGVDPDTQAMLLGEIASFLLVENSGLPPSLFRRLQALALVAIVGDDFDSGLWRSGVTLAQAIVKNGESTGSAAALQPPPPLVTAIASKVESAIANGDKALADGMFEFLRLCTRSAARLGHRPAMFRAGGMPGDGAGAGSARGGGSGEDAEEGPGAALAAAASALLTATGRLHMDRVHIEKTLRLATEAARAAGHDQSQLSELAGGLCAQAGQLVLASAPSVSEAACKLVSTLVTAALATLSASRASPGMRSPKLRGSATGGRDSSAGGAERAEAALARSVTSARLVATLAGTVAPLLLSLLSSSQGSTASSDTTAALVGAAASLLADRHTKATFAACAEQVGLRRAVCSGILAACGVRAGSDEWRRVRPAADDVELLLSSHAASEEASGAAGSEASGVRVPTAPVHGSKAARQGTEASGQGAANEAVLVRHRLAMPPEMAASMLSRAASAISPSRPEDMLGWSPRRALGEEGTAPASSDAMLATPPSLSARVRSPFCSAEVKVLADAAVDLLQAGEEDARLCMADAGFARTGSFDGPDLAASLRRCEEALASVRRLLEPPLVVTGFESVAAGLPVAVASFLRVRPGHGADSSLAAIAAAKPALAGATASPAGPVQRLQLAVAPGADAALGARRLHVLASAFCGGAPGAAGDGGAGRFGDVSLAMDRLCRVLRMSAIGGAGSLWSHVGHHGVFEQPSQLAHFGKHAAFFELRPSERSLQAILDRARLAGASAGAVQQASRVLRGLLRRFKISLPLNASGRHIKERLASCLAAFAAGVGEDAAGNVRGFGALPDAAWEGRGAKPVRLALSWKSAELAKLDCGSYPRGDDGGRDSGAVAAHATALLPGERLLQMQGSPSALLYVVARPGDGEPYVGLHIRNLAACTSRVWVAVRARGRHQQLVVSAARDEQGRLLTPDPRGAVLPPRAAGPASLRAEEGGRTAVVRFAIPPGGLVRDAVALRVLGGPGSSSGLGASEASAAASVPVAAANFVMSWASELVLDKSEDLLAWPAAWPSSVHGPLRSGPPGEDGERAFKGGSGPRPSPQGVLMGRRSGAAREGIGRRGIGRGAYDGTLARSRSGAAPSAAAAGTDEAVYGHMDPDGEGKDFEGFAVSKPVVAQVVRLDRVAARQAVKGQPSCITRRQAFFSAALAAAATPPAATTAAVVGGRLIGGERDAGGSAQRSGSLCGGSLGGGVAADPEPSQVKQVRLCCHPPSAGGPASHFLVTVVIADPSKHVPDRPGLAIADVPAAMATALLPVDARAVADVLAGTGSLDMATKSISRKARRSVSSPDAGESPESPGASFGGAGPGSLFAKRSTVSLSARLGEARPRDGPPGVSAHAGDGEADASEARIALSALDGLLADAAAAGVAIQPDRDALRAALRLGAPSDAERLAEPGQPAIAEGAKLQASAAGRTHFVAPDVLRPGVGLDEEAALARALQLQLSPETAASLDAAEVAVGQPRAGGAAAPDPAGTPADESGTPIAFRAIVTPGESMSDLFNVLDKDGRFGAPGTFFVHAQPLDSYFPSVLEARSPHSAQRASSGGSAGSSPKSSRRRSGRGSSGHSTGAADRPHSPAGAAAAAAAAAAGCPSPRECSDSLYPDWISAQPSKLSGAVFSSSALVCVRLLFRAFASAPLLPRDTAEVEAAASGVTSGPSKAAYSAAPSRKDDGSGAAAATAGPAVPSSAVQQSKHFAWLEGGSLEVSQRRTSKPVPALDLPAHGAWPTKRSALVGGQELVSETLHAKLHPAAMTVGDFARFVTGLSGQYMDSSTLQEQGGILRAKRVMSKFGRTHARAVIEACRRDREPLPDYVVSAIRDAGERRAAVGTALCTGAAGGATDAAAAASGDAEVRLARLAEAASLASKPPSAFTNADVDSLVALLCEPELASADAEAVATAPANAFGFPWRPALSDGVLTEPDFVAFMLEAAHRNSSGLTRDFAGLGFLPAASGFLGPFLPPVWSPHLPLQWVEASAGSEGMQMPEEEDPSELDLEAVRQVLLRSALQPALGKASLDDAISSRAGALAMVRHGAGAAAPAVERLWGRWRLEDEGEVAYVHDDALGEQHPLPEEGAGHTDGTARVRIVGVRPAAQRPLVPASERAAAHAEARRQAALTAARAAVAGGSALAAWSDASIAKFLSKQAADHAGGWACGAGSASGIKPAAATAASRRLTALEDVAAAQNSAALLRPERMLAGLAQELRVFLSGAVVDEDASVYAIDTFAPVSGKSASPQGAAGKDPAPGEETMGGIPVSLALGRASRPRGRSPPEAPPASLYVGSYIAVDWTPFGVNRWYGAVVRSMLQCPGGVRHVLDYDDGDTYSIDLSAFSHVFIAPAGSFGLTPEDTAEAEAAVPTPPGAVLGPGRSHRIGRRPPPRGGSRALRMSFAKLLRERQVPGHARLAQGSSRSSGPDQARSTRILHYDLAPPEVGSLDQSWLRQLEAGTGAAGALLPPWAAAGPLLLTGPGVPAPAVAPADGDAPAPDMSALQYDEGIQAAAAAGASSQAAASAVPSPAPGTLPDGSAERSDASVPVPDNVWVLPAALFVPTAAIDRAARRALGLSDREELIGAGSALSVEVGVAPEAARKEPSPSSDADSGAHDAEDVCCPVVLSGGGGMAAAFAEAAPVARASSILPRSSPVSPLLMPSHRSLEGLLLRAGSMPADSPPGELERPELRRSLATLAAIAPEEVAAFARQLPWLALPGGTDAEQPAGDALASLAMVARVAQEVVSASPESAARATASDFEVAAAASAFETQLGDNVAVAFGCLPRWLRLVAVAARFAIPHALRRRYFFYVAFGPTRRMLAVQEELGQALPGESADKAAARARARDNDPERIIITHVKAVASRRSVLRSARAIFRWWCAPLQRHQRSLALVRRARLLAQAEHAATTPWAAPEPEAPGSARAVFAAGLHGASELPPAELQRALGGQSAPKLARSSGLGSAATPASLCLPLPPPWCDDMGRRKGELNVSFAGEEAHGAGVTREFYTLVFRRLRETRLGLWMDTPSEDEGVALAAAASGVEASRRFVFAPHGLFPAPLPADADDAARVLDLFVLAGRAAAKALEDGHRDIDFPVSVPFAKLLLEAPVGLADMAVVDPDMGPTVRVLGQALRMLDRAEALGRSELRAEATAMCEALCLTWCVGTDELVPGGADVEVTVGNVRAFCRALVHHRLVRQASVQARAFRHGFASIADVSALRMLSPEELASLLSDLHVHSGASQDHLWRPEAIRESLLFHDSSQFRFERDSPAITDFVRALSELSPADRRLFLEFATASPRLPEEGFSALRPRRLQVNKRTPARGRTPDDVPIFCRVCTSELSLPEYSSYETLKRRLHEAIHSIADGLGGFRQHA